MSAPLARAVSGAAPLFVAWRTGRNFGDWHLVAGGLTVCGLPIPTERVSTTHQPASACTTCCRVGMLHVQHPPVPLCENRWRPRHNSTGYCTSPATVRAGRPAVLGGDLNLCQPCYTFLLGGCAVTGRVGEPLPDTRGDDNDARSPY